MTNKLNEVQECEFDDVDVIYIKQFFFANTNKVVFGILSYYNNIFWLEASVKSSKLFGLVGVKI